MTKVVMEMLTQWREQLKEEWANGRFQDNVENASAAAKTMLLESVVNIEYQDIVSFTKE